MDKLNAAVNELQQAQAAWDDFKRAHYMPWQLDAPTTYQRRADENFRAYAQKLSDRLQKARENLIAEAQRFSMNNPIDIGKG